jgi:urea carboxylase-associated protein 1
VSVRQIASELDPRNAVLDEIVPAGEPWMGTVLRGQVLRIVDLEGGQTVDAVFYNAVRPAERYSAVDTIRAQGSLYLMTGTTLLSSEGSPMLAIVADTFGRHDTLGGACSAESNTVRYALGRRHMHSCRDNFLKALARHGGGLDKRDLPANISFFMNVPVTPEGSLVFAEGSACPGRYVEMRAAMDLLVLISNCPQLENLCKAGPRPIQVLVWS